LDDHLLDLGADTIVVHDGVVLGKPVDEKDAERMLNRLSGQNGIFNNSSNSFLLGDEEAKIKSITTPANTKLSKKGDTYLS